MGSLLEDMLSAGSDLIGLIGEGNDAVFYPVTGPPASCTVWLDNAVEIMPGGYDGQAESEVTEIRYLLSVVGKVAERGELFIINGAEHRVESVTQPGDKGGIVGVLVK